MKKFLLLLILAVSTLPAEITVDFWHYSTPPAAIPAWLQFPQRDGVWVLVRTDAPDVSAFEITITYRDEHGRARALTETAKVYAFGQTGYANTIFWTGKAEVLEVFATALKRGESVSVKGGR